MKIFLAVLLSLCVCMNCKSQWPERNYDQEFGLIPAFVISPSHLTNSKTAWMEMIAIDSVIRANIKAVRKAGFNFRIYHSVTYDFIDTYVFAIPDSIDSTVAFKLRIDVDHRNYSASLRNGSKQSLKLKAGESWRETIENGFFPMLMELRKKLEFNYLADGYPNSWVVLGDFLGMTAVLPARGFDPKERKEGEEDLELRKLLALIDGKFERQVAEK